MGKSETRKADSYMQQLLQAKSHGAVAAGVRVIIYRTCAFTSLGELGKGSIKFVNAAAGYLKKRLTNEHERRPPLDGRTPQQHSAKLRFLSLLEPGSRLPSLAAMASLQLLLACRARCVPT